MAIQRYHRCNCQYCTAHTPCLICGRAEEVQRAHIIPQHLFQALPSSFPNDISPWLAEEGHNVIPLCKNHHTKFDNFRLTYDELQPIKDILADKMIEFLRFLGTHAITHQFREKFQRHADKKSAWADTLI